MKLFSVLFNSFIVTGMLLVLSSDCFAYLDTGTSSYILQVILAISISIAVAVKSYWFRIKSFFSRFSKKNSQSPNTSSKD